MDRAMDLTINDDVARVWSASGVLPSCSRTFDLFTQPRDADGHPSGPQDQLFVPVYLGQTAYGQLLGEAHRAKLQAQKEAKRSTTNGAANKSTALPCLPPQSNVHRGLAHTVIERLPPLEDDAAVPLLPTRWNRDDVSAGLEIQPNDLALKCVGHKNQPEREHDASAVRADHYIPPQCGLYYFEVQILNGKRDDTAIAIGFSTKSVDLSRPVGRETESWGYHSDDGRCFSAQNMGRPYGSGFTVGDVVGCGLNFRDHTAFFTKNGVKLGVAFRDINRNKLYPSVSLKRPGEHILVNFGRSPFVYNIADLMREQRTKVYREISASDTSQIEPGMAESDLIQALVLQFLQHGGYVETARAFAEDLKMQRQALNFNAQTEGDGISLKDEEDANNRQRIRRAILDGDVDRALKFTNAYYPRVLQDNEEVYFKLQCRKFIEMVRRAAYMRLAMDPKRSNGHGAGSCTQEMDIDHNGTENPPWGDSMEMDGAEQQSEVATLEQEMLEYGQSLAAEYANDSRKEVSRALKETWALVAYTNPLQEPQVSHLLDTKGRGVVAEELNSAILSSQGKASRAALEKVYAQTSVLLEDLRQDGGPGAFVSLQSLVEDVKASPLT